MCFSIIAQISQTLPLIAQDSSSNASESYTMKARTGGSSREIIPSLLYYTHLGSKISVFLVSVYREATFLFLGLSI